MNLNLLTLTALLGASVAWEIDPRCPGYERRLQGPVHFENKVPKVATYNDRSLRRGSDHRELQLSPSFQLKMYWEEGYCWQEEWIERKWCMSCQGSSCESGEPLWVQFCNAIDQSQRFHYIPVAGTDGGRLMTATTDLCLQRIMNNNTFELATCRSLDMDTQIFLGIKTDGSRFELGTNGNVGKCLVNYWHHPKAGEVIFSDNCLSAQIHHTTEWTTYNGGSESNPLTASDLTNLKFRVNNCTSSRPCGLCEGACAMDKDCESGMKCFHRNATETVPGCYGAGLFQNAACYLPVVPITNLSLISTILRLISPECNVTHRCGVCEGDCDHDDECTGTLKCFQRNGLELVPGCSGTGISGKDYCHQPLSFLSNNSTLPIGNHSSIRNNSSNVTINIITSNSSGMTALNLITPECSNSSRCGVCQGDCDRNSECMGSLKCFQRNGLEVVPGCSGTGVSGKDYCYLPLLSFSNTSSIVTSNTTNSTKNFTASTNNSSTILKLRTPNCSNSTRCGACEGDCNFDMECTGTLKCFQREGLEIVPGCSGAGTAGKDYCYQPSVVTANKKTL